MSLSQAHVAPWTLLLTLAACTPAPLHAQVTSLAETPMRFERLDGLSHNTVLSMVQDQQGFLWIGTVDGLNRYDGYDFVVYRHDPTDSPRSRTTACRACGKTGRANFGSARPQASTASTRRRDSSSAMAF